MEKIRWLQLQCFRLLHLAGMNPGNADAYVLGTRWTLPSVIAKVSLSGNPQRETVLGKRFSPVKPWPPPEKVIKELLPSQNKLQNNTNYTIFYLLHTNYHGRPCIPQVTSVGRMVSNLWCQLPHSKQATPPRAIAHIPVKPSSLSLRLDSEARRNACCHNSSMRGKSHLIRVLVVGLCQGVTPHPILNLFFGTLGIVDSASSRKYLLFPGITSPLKLSKLVSKSWTFWFIICPSATAIPASSLSTTTPISPKSPKMKCAT